ncbi:MAG: hypothetical protein LBO66_15540 [Deltaproteobacteria bacterium]|jgi:hypothetical protein|nr:hypothetical protein [Deltaproteobacteria bacterium]
MNRQQRTPRSVDIIKEQLGDLEAVKASLNTEVEIDLATSMTMDSLALHEEDLREELAAAEFVATQCDMELVLDGPSVARHSVPVDLLSKFLDQVQKLRFAIAETASGSQRDRGRFANKLVEENRLMVECFAPSSFAIRLSYANTQSSATLFETERPDDGLFMSLLSGETDSEELSGFSMSPRLRSYYQDFLSLVAEHEVTVGARTKKWPYWVKMSPQNARDRTRLINYALSPAEEDEVTIEGILVAGDTKNNSFGIVAGAMSYRGRVSESGVACLRRVALGSHVRVRLRVTTHREESGRPSYTLVALEAASDRVNSQEREV